jgi:hypothetical protein
VLWVRLLLLSLVLELPPSLRSLLQTLLPLALPD